MIPGFKPFTVWLKCVHNLFRSDQGLVGQCSVQLSCRWYDVPRRKKKFLPQDGTTSTLKFTTTTVYESLLRWTTNESRWCSRQQVVKGQVACTLVGCSTWRLVTSSRWLLTIILIEMAPKFTCTPITVTLAHFWSELFFCYLKLNKHCHRGANTTSPDKLRDVSLKTLPHF